METVVNHECKNCGARLQFDPSSVSMTCAFCGSEYFVDVPETPEEKKEREDAEIILFKVEKDEAKKIFSEWIKKGMFKPNDLTSSFKKKDFDGVYIPFYRVNADAVTQWTGRDKVETKSATENEPAQYEYKDRSGSHSESYKDFIEVTKGLEQGEVDRIQPFDDNDTKAYSAELMQGYKFEKPDMQVHNAEEAARDRIKENERDACSSYADEISSTSTTISNLRSKLMMLPIWVLVYLYKGKAFRVLINGQTGKIAGKKPTSGLKVFLFLLVVAAVIAGVIVLVKLL